MILDCDYSVDETEKKGLVVKWFHERKQSPVYQWIPNQKPIDLGILKGKLNLDFRADSDEFKLHRALQIIRPTIELSGKLSKKQPCFLSFFFLHTSQTNSNRIFFPTLGDWICEVSTFEGKIVAFIKNKFVCRVKLNTLPIEYFQHESKKSKRNVKT